MRLLKQPLDRPGELWFQHKSPHGPFDRLEPQTYKQLIKQRSESMDPEDAVFYVGERAKHEAAYRDLLGIDMDRSFTYATLVGHELMEAPGYYPGNTHYFKLTVDQANACIFELVAGKDHGLDVDPGVGVTALLACVEAWVAHAHEYKPYQDDVVGGLIEPRIEVVIPFPVDVIAVYPEEEMRST